MFRIRHGRPEDAALVAAVEAECFPAAEAATAAELGERLKYFGSHFWLLFADDKLVGFADGMVTDNPDLQDKMYADASLHSEDGAWQMIFGLNTIPAYRRQGCAAMLLEAIAQDARRQGRSGVVLTCKEHLLHYYARFGYVNEGVSQSVHGGVVWYQMRLAL